MLVAHEMQTGTRDQECAVSYKVTFEQIIEARAEDLPGMAQNEDHSIEEFYGQVILNFLREDLPNLEKYALKSRLYFSQNREIKQLEIACLLRLRIRQMSFDAPLVQQAEIMAATSTRWKGELAILLGAIYGVAENFSASQKWYLRAAIALEKQFCFKKALRARMNSLVCESHLNPHRNLVAEYLDIYRASLKKNSRDLNIAGTCLLNISREFQAAGSLAVALKYCHRGVTLAEMQFSSLGHHLLVAQRAYLFCQMGRLNEARVDFDFLSHSVFAEVIDTLEMIRPLLERESKNLTQTEKSKSFESALNLTVLEEKLILFLRNGPRDQVEILNHIYGAQLPLETKLGRFKNLLSTIRRKSPQLLQEDVGQGSYKLSRRLERPQLTKAR